MNIIRSLSTIFRTSKAAALAAFVGLVSLSWYIAEKIAATPGHPDPHNETFRPFSHMNDAVVLMGLIGALAVGWYIWGLRPSKAARED